MLHLGPYSLVLRIIVYGAQDEREDKGRVQNEGEMVLWRASVMTLDQINHYKKILKDKLKERVIRLMGFTCCLRS